MECLRMLLSKKASTIEVIEIHKNENVKCSEVSQQKLDDGDVHLKAFWTQIRDFLAFRHHCLIDFAFWKQNSFFSRHLLLCEHKTQM